MNAGLRDFALWVIIALLLLALFTLFSESSPTHGCLRHPVLSAAQRSRPGARARCLDSGTGGARHLQRRPQLSELCPERPGLDPAALSKGRIGHDPPA